MDKLLVVLVEDNPGDVAFFQEALEASGVQARVQVLPDGGAAMAFLRRQGPHQDASRPDVVVLDLNLPVKNGYDVIREMGDDPDLRTIPIALLTTSTSESSACDRYSGRCIYFAKTDDFGRLQEIVRQIAHHAGGGSKVA